MRDASNVPLEHCRFSYYMFTRQMSRRDSQDICNMLICVNVVQVCDARDDDSSNAAGNKKIVAYKYLSAITLRQQHNHVFKRNNKGITKGYD